MSRNKCLNKHERQNNIKEYDYSMTAIESVGVFVILVGALMIYFGMQFLANVNISPFGIPFSYIGLLLIALGLGLIIWFVKKKLR